MDLRDLIDRTDRAEAEVARLARGAGSEAERARLAGKAEGLRLALSYMREAQRDAATGWPRRPVPGGGLECVGCGAARPDGDGPLEHRPGCPL